VRKGEMGQKIAAALRAAGLRFPSDGFFNFYL
jgi:hypothetical protein